MKKVFRKKISKCLAVLMSMMIMVQPLALSAAETDEEANSTTITNEDFVVEEVDNTPSCIYCGSLLTTPFLRHLFNKIR